jgi:hypothetical protein
MQYSRPSTDNNPADSSSEDESTSSSSSTRPVAHRLSPVAGPLLDKGKGKARQENEIDASRGQDMEVDDHYVSLTSRCRVYERS